MKILFLTNSLNYRGTTNAILDYAYYNQELLGNESIIGYDPSSQYEQDVGNEDKVVEEVKSKFRVVNYSNDIEKVANVVKPDIIYKLDAGGEIDNKSNIKLAHHAVFQFKNDTISAYVSKWLSDTMTDGKIPFVPHIVNLPDANKNYREFFNIPKDAVIVGRHGGYKTFDIPFVKRYIKETIDLQNVYYLFLNTEPFIKHSKVIHINSTFDRQKLSNFIDTCDVMLHARQRGESFGLAIAEFLFHNKPVLACYDGLDKNHHTLTEYLYKDEMTLHSLICNVPRTSGDYKSSVKNYSPSRVMKSFNKYFIEN